MTEKTRILYLDDEENNLFAFKALFRRDYDVFTTTSPQEAVQYLNQHHVPIIFSDQKMPDLSGVEFFELTTRDFPDAIRILITGYADIEAVIDAINKGQVYRYVTKPWNENDLRICIQNALDTYNNRLELRYKNEGLARLNAELEKFVYSASHDLRAPLMSIKGVVNLARMDDIGDKAKTYLEMIERSTNRLDHFLTNIIHYYQNLKSDEILSELNFGQLIDEIYEQYRYYEGAEFMQFRKEINQSAPAVTDVSRLKMILGNLISNTIRFRDPHAQEPHVLVHGVINPLRIVIHVEDNGVGIPPETLPRVFEMFFRNTDLSLGTGIGLHIAREAARKMGGDITVTSESGKGTRFTIDLPNRSQG